jgi:hypothetical protein
VYPVILSWPLTNLILKVAIKTSGVSHRIIAWKVLKSTLNAADVFTAVSI